METDILKSLRENPKDEQAWTALYVQFRPWVYAVCFKWLGHFDDAEDATQQTFMHLATNWRHVEFSDLFHLRSYLKCIAISRSIDLLRKRKGNGPIIEPRETDFESAALRSIDGGVQKIDDLPEFLGLSDEKWDGLSHRRRQVLWLSYLGYSYREIIDQLGISERTVRRDLDHLRKLLHPLR